MGSSVPWTPLLVLLSLTGVLAEDHIDPYSSQPKLTTQNGHLIIMASLDKNITLRTSGAGYVNLNDENLVHVSQMAQHAAKTVVEFQQNFESNIQFRLNLLSRLISGPHGLTTKMAALEQQVNGGNITSSSSGMAMPGPSRGTVGIRLNRLGNRLRSVEIQLRNLRSLLTVDECLSNPCRNGGTCQDLFNGFICICPINWEGVLCDEDVNECLMFAGTDLGCQNGASCTNKPGSYECTCPDGFFGLHCTLRVNDCTSQNSAQLCGHGVCINQGGNGRGYTCICDEGWTKDLANSCTVDKDECQDKRYPCSHDPYVQCINLPGSFHCGLCPAGYTGNGYQCTDINECEINNGGCSLIPRVSCRNIRGSRICGHCPPGFTGDGVTCTAMEGGACAINNGGCFPSAQCFQNAGIVTCKCPNGYAGNGYGLSGCTPSTLAFHPCHSNPCKNGGTCVPHGSTTTCICHPHLTGADCSVPIYTSCSPNPCLNNGTCSIYSEVQGFSRVMCTCPLGWEGDRCQIISSDCGGMLYQESGELQVPTENAIQLYQNGKLCSWHIEVPSYKVIQLTITEMNIDSSENCDKNFVRIHDPTLSGTWLRYCRTYSRAELPVYTSPSNKLTVTFYTTSGIHKNSFKLSWTSVDPTCGGVIRIESHGTIQSPHYPQNYPPNLDCEWKLLAPPGKKIQFLFNAVHLEPSTDCSKDFLKIQEFSEYAVDELTDVIAKFCNTSNPASVTTHLSSAFVLFHSDKSGAASGFSFTYTLLNGCGNVLTSATGVISPPMGSDGEYQNELDCEWRIQLPLGDKVEIMFTSFDIEEGYDDACDDYVELHDGPSSTSPLIGKWCGKTLPSPYTSSSNTLTVLFHSDFLLGGAGFSLSYKTSCGETLTGLTGEIRSPNYPSPYSAETECVFKIVTPPGTVIQLHFQDFVLESLGEGCEYDYLEIHDGDTANSTLVGKYCGEINIEDIISSFNYLYIVFTADSSNQQRGFLANYSTIDIPCGGILKETTGSFSSPQDEEGYIPNSRCKWLISAPPGWAIQLSWISFHLEYSRDCRVDAVEVYENNTDTGKSSLIDRYCGLKIPPSTTSTTNLMTIVFYTDDSVHREGFTAHYIMVDKRKVCGGTYRSITGVLQSPNHPDFYPDNKECIWMIHVPQGQQIMLKFETFNVEGDYPSCHYDSLEIRNGLHETSPIVGKYCGNELPPNVVSLTNALWIHFSSDKSNVEKGFSATWDATSTGCGGTLSSPTGTIFSPNYPQPYSRYAECLFRISVSQGSRVRLMIVDIDLEEHTRCNLDYIEVFDGANDRSKSLGRFCSKSHPPYIPSSSNHMFIKFVSDISYSGRGFQLAYNTECNVTLNSHYGAIESPNYPGKYHANLNCHWTIHAPMGNTINITFLDFDLEEGMLDYESPNNNQNECKYDYVELSEGSTEDSPGKKIGRYCGNQLPQLISSERDNIHVHFVTDHLFERKGFHLEWVVSGCGGIYREKPSGILKSPNYPSGYPNNKHCEWQITAPWDKSIEITINDMQIEDWNSCMHDSLTIYYGEDITAPKTVLCHHQTSPQVFTTSGNHAFIVFVSDSSISGKGFSASWKFVDSKCGGKFTSPFGVIASHNYPRNYDNDDDCEWLIEIPGNHLINLTFTDFDVEAPIDTGGNTHMETDYVRVYDGATVNDPVLLTHSGNELPNPPYIISSNNTLLIRHKADGSLTAKGFHAQYSMACGARISAKGTGTFSMSGIVSSTNPLIPEHSQNCTWYIIAENPTDKITLTFTFLDVSPNAENNDDSCSYNYVAVHDGDNTNSTVTTRICGTKVPPPIQSSGSALTVQAVGLSSIRSHLGRFTALYSTLSTACGGELVSEQGAIASPNFPDGYPSGAECEWQLKASPGNRVSLSFRNFSLEQSDYCNSDYVEIHSGSISGPLQGVFCGSELPTNLTADNALWIRFRSDSVNTAAGFVADYSLVHGIDLAGDSGQIASPLYPKPFVQEGEYTWTISVSNRKVIRITFNNFYMDSYSDEDCFAYLQVFDGPNSESPSLLKTCGAALPKPVVSTNNIVTVYLKNSPWVHGSVFLLSWESVALVDNNNPFDANEDEDKKKCGKEINLIPKTTTNNSATITTPNHPQEYESDLSCDWIIDTLAGFHLKLKFNKFDLEHYDDCDVDTVTVFTGTESDPTGWKPISPNLCLPNTTEMLFEAGNRMKIHFESDHSLEKTGFSAQVVSVCGGLLSDPNGVIDSTQLPVNSSIGKVTCDWEFAVRSGRTIQFTFDDFNLPKVQQGTCSSSYILFRNGGHKDSPLLGDGKYCGNIIPSIPKTSSNRAYVSYTAWGNAPGVILRYQEVDYECKYDIKLGGSVQNMTISSPNYPQSPSVPHITCVWVVTAPPGETVQIDFIDRFDLKRSVRCELEYVEVRDGATELSHLMGKWCTITPSPLNSQGNRMYIKYFTDTDVPNNGFRAMVKIGTCGGTYFDRSLVVLDSPQYPNSYPPNIECTWRIVGATTDHQLYFNVTELSFNDEDNCETAQDYLEILNVNTLTNNQSDTLSLGRLCGQISPEVNGSSLIQPSSTNEVLVRFHSGPGSRFSSEKKRFQIRITVKRQRCYKEITAPSGEIMNPGYPNPVPSRYYTYCTWVLTVPEGRRVSLKLIDVDLAPSKDSSWNQYKMIFLTGNTPMIAAWPDSLQPGSIIESFGNVMKVIYHEDDISGAHRGFKAQFSSEKPIVCGGKLEDKGLVTFSPRDQNYTYYRCEWDYTRDPISSNQTTFTVTINGTVNSNITRVSYLDEDNILISTDIANNAAGTTLASINDEMTSPLTVRSPFSKIVVLAYRRGGYPKRGVIKPKSSASFSISFKIDPCGGILDGPEATITSPGYPGSRTPNVDCAWLVKFQPNTKIKVKFESVDLDEDCSKEYLKLYNGGNPQQPHLIDPLCGSKSPPELRTQHNTMFVEFHSDLSKSNLQGFKMVLTEEATGCGGILHQRLGTVESPNYDTGDYPNNTECDWTIIVPSGFHANISFVNRFNLETSVNCANDFIQIFDWYNGKWQQIGSNICGRTPPTDLKTKTNKFRVLFRTNPTVTGDGFKLSWNSVCGGVIQVTGNGSIISPNYPKTYFRDLNCSYTLLASSETIYGKFEDFSLEGGVSGESDNCRYDNVTLTTFTQAIPYMRMGRPVSRTVTLCGFKEPEPVLSYGVLELWFRTDPYLQYKGFLFQYSVFSCGGNITSPTTITNPNSTHFHKCTWFVTAPPDKIVVLKIKRSDRFFGSCTNTGLRLYNNHNVTNRSSLIEQLFCDFEPLTKTRYTSSGNKMAIQYLSDSFFSATFEAAIGFTYGEKHKCGGTIRTINLPSPYTLTPPDIDGNGKYEPLLSCQWLILAPEGHQVRFKIDRLDLQNCSTGNKSCDCDFVEMYDGDNEFKPLLGRFCGSIPNPNIEMISSTGSLLVHFNSDGATELSGFQLTIKSFPSPCSPLLRNATNEVQLLTSPDNGESTQHCLWQILAPFRSGLLSLKFTRVNLPLPCENNFITVVDKKFRPSDLDDTFPSRRDRQIWICGNRSTEMVFSTQNVQIHYSTNKASPQMGFTMEYKLKGCSQTYTEPNGRIIVNKFYQGVPDDDTMVCNNLIQLPQQNATISLYFNMFWCFEPRRNQDVSTKMVVYDGPSDQAKEIASFCNNRRPNPIFSSGPSLFIRFRSLRRISKFDITYTSTDKGRGCGGRFKDLSGSFSSPLYPSTYKVDSSCRWDITVPHGNKIYFYFTYFDIGETFTCNTNYIQFYDVDYTTGLESLHSRYCGHEKPAKIMMTGETAYVRYVTTVHNNGTGWVLQWSIHPTGLL